MQKQEQEQEHEQEQEQELEHEQEQEQEQEQELDDLEEDQEQWHDGEEMPPELESEPAPQAVIQPPLSRPRKLPAFAAFGATVAGVLFVFSSPLRRFLQQYE